jgi:hypothetical protein
MGQQLKKISIVRIGKLLFVSLIVSYLLLCAGMAIFQRSFIYFPTESATSFVDRNARIVNLQRWMDSKGQPIGFKRLSPKQPSEGSVLVMYGNASTAVESSHYADNIQLAAPLDVYIMEYPGYEDRAGSPSQSSFFQAGEDALQSLPNSRPIYLVGESLGSGTASYLAGTFSNRVAGILLLSPFNRLTDVAQYHYRSLPVWLLLMDRFPSEDYLQNYHGKVAITVDGGDDIVPEKFGLRLYESYHGPKKLWEFRNAGHTQITGSVSEFCKEVIAFWQSPK